MPVLEARLGGFLPAHAGLSDSRRKELWATVLVLWVFETKLAGEKDVWELVAEKAQTWVDELPEVSQAEIQASAQLVQEVVNALTI